MKMIICAKRNPALSRPEFFNHLRHVHWPLVRDNRAVAGAIDGYIQNHALGNSLLGADVAPCRIAADRDSVIELFFDGEAGLQRLLEVPEYLELVRPDEAYFNDLPRNIMVKTQVETVFQTRDLGRCKRFDFLVKADGWRVSEFKSAVREDSSKLCLDPAYTALIDRHDLNWNIDLAEEVVEQGFGHGSFDCVRELCALSMTNFTHSMAFARLAPWVDANRSFSVFATEFVMLPLAGPSRSRSE